MSWTTLRRASAAYPAFVFAGLNLHSRLASGSFRSACSRSRSSRRTNSRTEVAYALWLLPTPRRLP